MSLRVRLVVVVGTLVAVTVAVVSSLAWWLAAREIREPTDDLIERRTDLLVQAAADTDSDATIAGTTLDGLRRALDFDLLGGEVFLQYLGADGEPVSEVVMPVTDDDRRIARAGDAPVWRTDDVDGVTLRIRTTAMPGGALTLGEDVSAGERAIDDLRDRLVVVGLVGVAVAVAVAVVVARRIATPVARVADAAEDLASGADAPGRIEAEGSDEIARLATSFNRMVEALEVSREQQRRLVADASHELRTPLTSLRMKIEHLGRNPDLDDAARQQLLDDAVGEFAALGDLVNELVVLATEPGDVDEPETVVDLGDLVSDTAERARRRTGREITVEVTDARVKLRPRLVARALWNLLDNADKYSPAGAGVTIVATPASIEVRDGGPGIPDDERDAVFDRFYRGPRARDSAGSGIGLAIVRRVAELHGGRPYVRDAPGGGAVVGFTLPETHRPPSEPVDDLH